MKLAIKCLSLRSDLGIVLCIRCLNKVPVSFHSFQAELLLVFLKLILDSLNL